MDKTDKLEACPIYVASRASLPERGIMWRQFRGEGVAITSSWIDEDGEGRTADFGDLWLRIAGEIQDAAALVLYAEREDFPLKGALIEAGIALGMGKPVIACLPDLGVLPRNYRPIGSWIAHPLVTRCDNIRAAVQLAMRSRASVAAPPPEKRHYSCSCGGALTAEEYIEHYFEKGHDRGDPTVRFQAAAVEIVKAWLWHTPEHDQERARISITAILSKHLGAAAVGEHAELQRRLFDECVTANWDPERRNTFAEEIAHLHEELSEAFRAWRRYKDCEIREVNGKLEGVPIEFADVVIGLFYNAELHGFNLLEAVERKHEFNLKRNYIAEGRQLHAAATPTSTGEGKDEG